jgi:hypothetical protein
VSEIRTQDFSAGALEGTTRLSAADVIGIYLVPYVSQVMSARSLYAKYSDQLYEQQRSLWVIVKVFFPPHFLSTAATAITKRVAAPQQNPGGGNHKLVV